MNIPHDTTAWARFLAISPYTARLGIEAIAAFAKDGTKPAATEGKDFVDTGVQLVTDKPVEGVPSITSDEGLKLCWG